MRITINNYPIRREAFATLWVFLSVHFLWGQTYNERYIFEGIQAVSFAGIVESNDTLILLGRNATNYLPFPTKPAISRITSSGEFISSEHIIGDSSLNYSPYGGKIFSQRGSKIVVAGGAGNSLSNSLGMIAMIEDFSLKWVSTYNPSSSTTGFGFLSSLILKDYSLMLSGFEFHNITGDVGILVHTDSLGIELWRKEFWEPGYSHHLWSSMIESDTTLILGFGIKNHNEEYWHSMLMRIDTAGNEINRWVNDTEGTYEPIRILRTPDGGYLFVGKVFKEYVSDTGQPLYQGYICKLDSEWNKEWEQKIGFRGKTTFHNVLELEDGDFVAVGNVLDTFQTENMYYRKGWMVKFDINGNILWEQNPYKEGYAESYLFDVVELPDGDLVSCGVSVSHLGEDYPQRGWLVRVHADGCMDWGCFTDLEEYVSPEESPYVVAPNPVRDYFQVSVPTDVAAWGQIRSIESIMVYDVSGRMLLHEHYSKGTTSVEVDASDWVSGVYYVVVNPFDSAQGRGWVEKVMIE